MFPISLTLTDRRVVVVGGGVVAERKVRALLEAGARVTVISPSLTRPLAQLAEAGEITWTARLFAFGDCAGALLAFAATDDPGINAAVVVDARKHGILVNDAGDAERGDFITPAVHRSGKLTVTVDSSGLSPTFTTRIRDELAVQFDARYARAAATLGALRERTLAVVPIERRAEVMRHFAARDIDDLASMPPGAIEHEVERAVDTLGGVRPSELTTLVCATRGSALALWQTRSVMAQLAGGGIPSTVLTVTTKGDTDQNRALSAIGTDGVFVKELELALRERRADYAVHSCKDLPSTLADDLTLAAIGKREDPRDAFCSEHYASFETLPPGARVGTSSPRRRALLRALRPDLTYPEIRGNVDTRLRKLRDGDYDAIVLAVAGLKRLELSATYTVPFALEVLVPAVAQGALAIEMRAGDPRIAQIRKFVNDPQTEIAVTAERAFLRTLRGGCQAPVGAHARFDGEHLLIHAAIASVDGATVVRGDRRITTTSVAEMEAVAVELAEDMLAAGGAALLADEGHAGALAGCLFLLPRTQERPSRIAAALREAGAEVVEAVSAAAASHALAGRTPNALLFPSSGSVRAIEAYLGELHGARPIVAAMGPASAAAAAQAGWPADLVAPEADIPSFVHTVTHFVLEHTQ
ncbi:MAG: hydroxymethylbilane synthase [Candidatus Lustribacter sp.]|jgi:hydroxymethylbilane synthase